MQSILFAVFPLLLILGLPYLIAIWSIRHTTMRCMQISPVPAKEFPTHFKEIFKEAVAELKPLGFKVVNCHQILMGSEKDGEQWGVLLQHQSGHTFVGLMTAQMVSSAAPLIRSFLTVFEDETYLTTINAPHFGIYSPDPEEIAQYLGNVEVAEQWQKHQEKLQDLSPNQRIQKLTVETFLRMLETRSRESAARLVKTKEVVWQETGKTYRMTWRTAVRAVYQVVRQQKGLAPKVQPRKAQPRKAQSAAASTPLIAMEIAEFHRLQEKQQTGLSQRKKNWLLLGTLGLFIASYSSILNVQTLSIFVAVLLFHEAGHVLAMRLFGYRNTMMLFIPFLGALATARKENASLTEKVWVSLAGPLPGLLLGIALAVTTAPNLANPDVATWYGELPIQDASWMLITLNLFNLLPIYPLDGGQVADLLLFSRNPYIGVGFKGLGVLLLGLLGMGHPLLLGFALLIALTLPTSFRLAQLNSRFRQELRSFPQGNRDECLRFLFTQLQAPPYQALPFAKKYSLVVGLLDSRQENVAKGLVRAGLTGVYLVSLLGGLAGGLYAIVPNWSTWATFAQSTVNAEGQLQQRAQQEIEAANQTLLTHPQDAAAYLQRGRAYLLQGNDEAALSDVNQALQINPHSGESYQLRSVIYLRTGDEAGAKTDQQKAMALLTQEQLTVLDQQLQQNPEDAEAYLERASLHFTQQHYAEAIQDANQALLINPNNPSAVLIRGESYLALNKLSEALGNANHILRLDPNFADAYEFRSRVRQQLKDMQGASADQQKAEALYENEPYENESQDEL